MRDQWQEACAVIDESKRKWSEGERMLSIEHDLTSTTKKALSTVESAAEGQSLRSLSPDEERTMQHQAAPDDQTQSLTEQLAASRVTAENTHAQLQQTRWMLTVAAQQHSVTYDALIATQISLSATSAALSDVEDANIANALMSGNRMQQEKFALLRETQQTTAKNASLQQVKLVFCWHYFRVEGQNMQVI
jgi:hypothetical protein